ncbi:093L [Cherax quadricarinatus iridovirus]|uniref:Uncharacterized protein n=1 Tax=Shrimp hemocyte iridescent virus TaxID=2039780 RepID=A0A291B0Q0_9VIRU|nr:093L [Cherax quadricarinatus iridovirus]YP_010084812.1 hypothetical protein KM509_gp060 [Shrimp hemocyte iridescent virus]ASZ85073.1 093L [Cherax quadricarinatus iridovirus]ATE87069.1 hypothetical protein [Shrimp hemocyte iridescent virus]
MNTTTNTNNGFTGFWGLPKTPGPNSGFNYSFKNKTPIGLNTTEEKPKITTFGFPEFKGFNVTKPAEKPTSEQNQKVLNLFEDYKTKMQSAQSAFSQLKPISQSSTVPLEQPTVQPLGQTSFAQPLTQTSFAQPTVQPPTQTSFAQPTVQSTIPFAQKTPEENKPENKMSQRLDNKLCIFKTFQEFDLNKIIAIMSCESFCKNGFLRREILNPEFNSMDRTKVAQGCIVSFVDEKITDKMSPFCKLHISILRELYKETFSTQDDVWNFASQVADSVGLEVVSNFIKHARNGLELSNISFQDIDNENNSYVLALYLFITNIGNPIKAVSLAKNISPEMLKLVMDMCMSSYGLSWAFGGNLNEIREYISFHKNTYILSCE